MYEETYPSWLTLDDEGDGGNGNDHLLFDEMASAASDGSGIYPTNGSLNDSEICLDYSCLSDEDYLDYIRNYVFPTPYEWVLITLHIGVFAVGLIGNSLVCISVYRNHSMRTVTNYFIVNLAFADLLVILICLPPTVLWDVTETWFLGSVMCKLVLYLQGVSVSVSVLTLTFISVDRWYAICYPLHFKSTPARAKTAIGIIWACSMVLVLPDAIVLDTSRDSSLRVDTHYFTDCNYTWKEEDTRIYQLFIVLMLFIAPFALMSVAYYQIARVLWNKNIPGTQETNHTNPNPSLTSRSNRQASTRHSRRNGGTRRTVSSVPCEGQIRSRRKAAKMLIAVVVIFGLCYLPVHLINTLRYTIGLPQTHATTVASLISHWLCYANSAMNPIIYNFMSGKFRKEFRNNLMCMCWRQTHQGRWRTPANTYICRYTSTKTQCENVHLNSIVTRYT